MPEVNGLYPTPTRKRFVEDVDERLIYQQPEGDGFESYHVRGRKVTDLASQCERAAWIEPGAPLKDGQIRRWWQLTDLGRQVKDGIKKGEHGG